MRKQLNRWKAHYLSKGGKLTLIKSSLATIPIHFLSLFVALSSICKEMEKIQRDFLWRGAEDDWGLHLVARDRVCTTKDKGGTNLRRLQPKNRALLCKWLWHFGQEDGGLWRKVVTAKYGSREDWDPLVPRGPYGWSPWRGIMTQLESFKVGLAFVMGDGRCVCFWIDAWCGERPLRDVYPDIYAMVVDPNAVVASYLSIVGEEAVWLPTLWRAAFDWEIPSVAQFLDKLRGARFNLGLEDHHVWVNENSGLFSVKSCYEMLANVRMEEGPWKALWYTAVDMLWRKGFYMPSMCLLYY